MGLASFGGAGRDGMLGSRVDMTVGGIGRLVGIAVGGRRERTIQYYVCRCVVILGWGAAADLATLSFLGARILIIMGYCFDWWLVLLLIGAGCCEHPVDYSILIITPCALLLFLVQVGLQGLHILDHQPWLR